MARRRDFLKSVGAIPVAAMVGPVAGGQSTGREDREYWVSVARRLADPVLSSLAARQLKIRMPVETRPEGAAERARFSHLEAIGRLLAGLAPWLALDLDIGAEGELRRRYASLARHAIDAATDPASPDLLNFSQGSQPLVDAAFLAHALVRAPGELWLNVPAATRANVLSALRSSRRIKPGFNNWLLFSAMVEAFFCQAGEEWDPIRIDYAVRQHEQWYKGDGLYGDGPEFHWDYYNSFVIHPMLVDVLTVISKAARGWDDMRNRAIVRARRYAAIQERLISPEGTFPAIGRSLAYRVGAFQLLGQAALRHELPDGVSPAQVRCALTAVMRRMIEAPGTFDRAGWLTLGFCGHQPAVAETYISTGSLYLCATGLLPLGLPPTDEFWQSAPEEWTARRAWSGKDLPADHALS